MPLTFEWEDLWTYHECIEDDEIKRALEVEVIGEGWLFRQSEKQQTHILEHAPESFIKPIASQLKPRVAIRYGHNPFA